MSTGIQNLLSSIKRSSKESLWIGAKNEWVKELRGVRSAYVAQDIVLLLTNGKPAPINAGGYKVIVGEDRIEIKLATLGQMGNYPAFMWQGIDMSGDFTHLCLIAIYPDDARVFMVPRPEIDLTSMSRKGQSNKYQLTTRRIDELFPWMVRNEIA
jgi:hypothetical protein